MRNETAVLVTGASGFLGRRIVQTLVERGFPVRAFVRSSSEVDHLCLPGVTLFSGDVTDIETLEPAFEGVTFVIHAAVGKGSDNEIMNATVEGTRNILSLTAKYKQSRLVYISSCSVYGVGEYEEGQNINEYSPLERFSDQRGSYSYAKLKAERLVTKCMQENERIACLRPGTIYGRGGDNFSPMIGFCKRGKYFFVIDQKNFILPLVFIENLIDAILLVMTSERSRGKVYNVIDPYRIDKRHYVDRLIRGLHPNARVFYIPYALLSAAVWLQEKIFSPLPRKPFVSRYRLLSSQNPVVYKSDRIIEELGWVPPYTFEEAAEHILKGVK